MMFEAVYNSQNGSKSQIKIMKLLKLCVISALQITKLKQKLNNGNGSRLQSIYDSFCVPTIFLSESSGILQHIIMRKNKTLWLQYL